MRQYLTILAALMFAGSNLLAPGASHAQSKGEVVIGVQCDRSGPTQIVGTVLCPGFHDYITLVNSKGGAEGHKINALEIDHEYKVPSAVESYERFKAAGAVSIAVYGTPQIYALTEKLTEDRIPGTSPGFGRADAADGARYPYIFPIAATYWSQGAAAVDFVKKQLGGSLKGKKIAYIFYDNPAGREPIQIIEDLAGKEEFQLREFAVPPPGVEMGAQVLDIAQRYRADFVIAHLFGGAPAVSIKEFKRVGYPLRKVVSFVWGSAEANIDAAGGFVIEARDLARVWTTPSRWPRRSSGATGGIGGRRCRRSCGVRLGGFPRAPALRAVLVVGVRPVRRSRIRSPRSSASGSSARSMASRILPIACGTGPSGSVRPWAEWRSVCCCSRCRRCTASAIRCWRARFAATTGLYASSSSSRARSLATSLTIAIGGSGGSSRRRCSWARPSARRTDRSLTVCCPASPGRRVRTDSGASRCGRSWS